MIIAILTAIIIIINSAIIKGTSVPDQVPASFFLAQALVSTVERYDRLHKELHCLQPTNSWTNDDAPQVIKYLRERCQKDPEYKVLMQILAPAVYKVPTIRMMTLMLYVHSYDVTMKLMLKDLSKNAVSIMVDKCNNDELKDVQAIQGMVHGCDEGAIERLFNRIKSDQYGQFVMSAINFDDDFVSKHPLNMDEYGPDPAVQQLFDNLGLVLELPRLLSAKTTKGFFEGLQRYSNVMEPFKPLVTTLMGLYRDVYVKLESKKFDDIVKECQEIRDQVAKNVREANSLKSKLEMIADGEWRVLTIMMGALEGSKNIQKDDTIIELFQRHITNKYTPIVGIDYNIKNPYTPEPVDSLNTIDRVFRSARGKITMSMYTMVDENEEIRMLTGTLFAPSDELSRIHPLFPDDHVFASHLHHTVKSHSQQIRPQSALKFKYSGELPSIFLPQALLLAERVAWLDGVATFFNDAVMEHDKRLLVNDVLMRLKDRNVYDMEPPLYAIYKHDNKVLLKPSIVYDALLALLKNPTISDCDLEQHLMNDDGTVIILHRYFWKALKDIRVGLSTASPAVKHDDIINKLTALLRTTQDALQRESKELHGCLIVPYEHAVKVLVDLDSGALQLIGKLANSGTFTKVAKYGRDDNQHNISYWTKKLEPQYCNANPVNKSDPVNSSEVDSGDQTSEQEQDSSSPSDDDSKDGVDQDVPLMDNIDRKKTSQTTHDSDDSEPVMNINQTVQDTPSLKKTHTMNKVMPAVIGSVVGIVVIVIVMVVLIACCQR